VVCRSNFKRGSFVRCRFCTGGCHSRAIVILTAVVDSSSIVDPALNSIPGSETSCRKKEK
jgi:hypothetical protein